MHVKKILTNILTDVIHQSRLTLLTEVIPAISSTKKIQLTAIGRAISQKNLTQQRSRIRKMDRLLGNPFFQNQSSVIYAAIIQRVIPEHSSPNIIVDISKLPNSNMSVLRASLVSESRAITLYEEIDERPQRYCVHKKFLLNLRELLPKTCVPIVITDAGFKNPWFKLIISFGWNYLGRVRGKTKYCEDADYQECEILHNKAKKKAQYLGEKVLTKKQPLLTSFYIYTHKIKGRKHRDKAGKTSENKDSRNYAKSYREPWLLVSSIKNKAKKVVELYKHRMKIEESFRDMKSHQYGLDLENNHTQKSERLKVWLLLIAITSFTAWIIGYLGELAKVHLTMQANSTQHRRVLSYFYLGCEMIKEKTDIPIGSKEINLAFNQVMLYV